MLDWDNGDISAAPNKGTMKKVNKQCLLDTPRTVRVSKNQKLR